MEWERDPADGQLITERANGRKRVQTINKSASRTVQSDRDRADIRNILAQYEATGILTHMRDVDLQFRDISEFNDLSDAMQQAKQAEQVFMRLPSKLREVFDHDVTKWLDAAHDPEKIEALRPQLERLGVLDPIAPTEVPAAPVPEAEPPSE